MYSVLLHADRPAFLAANPTLYKSIIVMADGSLVARAWVPGTP